MLPERRYERFPYVPSDPSTRDERCAEVYEIQVQGLVKRLRRDRTQARRDRHLRRPRFDSGAAGMRAGDGPARLSARPTSWPTRCPGSRPAPRTLAQARRLMRPSDARRTKSTSVPPHPDAQGYRASVREGKEVYDVTFENVQAGERTSHLFRLANLRRRAGGRHRRSERAGAGMVHLRGRRPHVALRASTRACPRRSSSTSFGGSPRPSGWAPRPATRYFEILATPISPELVPGSGAIRLSGHRSGNRSLRTAGFQSLLHAALRIPAVQGSPSSPTARGAIGSADGWPDIPAEQRHQYGIAEIKQHPGIFLRRFFELSQFKRSCIPNAPKVGSGGSLSPRGDYRAPSDSEAAVWLEELELVPDQE